MSPKEQPTDLGQSKTLAGILALLIAEREERLNEKGEVRKTEVILADAGLSIGEIAALAGKNYDAVKMTIRRGRKKG
jgi:DNA-directed RNA polymerase specialized sigma24 family protein